MEHGTYQKRKRRYKEKANRTIRTENTIIKITSSMDSGDRLQKRELKNNRTEISKSEREDSVFKK